MKGRDSALFNGILIGGGIMFFAVAYLMYSIGEGVEALAEKLAAQTAEINAAYGLSLQVTVPELLPIHDAMFGCIILGIIALAIGIGAECYGRAKAGSSKEDKGD